MEINLGTFNGTEYNIYLFTRNNAGNIDESRIEKAKNRLKSKNIFEEENVSSLAQNIGYAYVLDFKDYHLNYESGIDKVTKEDIVAAAQKMTSGPMYFGITSNE